MNPTSAKPVALIILHESAEFPDKQTVSEACKMRFKRDTRKSETIPDESILGLYRRLRTDCGPPGPAQGLAASVCGGFQQWIVVQHDNHEEFIEFQGSSLDNHGFSGDISVKAT